MSREEQLGRPAVTAIDNCPSCQVSHRELLPSSMAELGDLLGDTSLLALLDAHAGSRLYVPEVVESQDHLAVLLGELPAKRFIRHYGRDMIVIGLCKKWRAFMLRREGLSYAVIGRRLGMHEQSVYRVLGSIERSGTKGNLDACLSAAPHPRQPPPSKRYAALG